MIKNQLEEFIRKGLSQRRIAEATNKSVGSVQYWLNKYRLVTRGDYNLKPHKCPCGETNPKNFYGHKRGYCKVCHTTSVVRIGKERRLKAVKHKGGECEKCGYNKCIEAMDFHRLDKNTKDPKFNSIRVWKWSRVLSEISKCVLLCSNCHRELHAKEK